MNTSRGTLGYTGRSSAACDEPMPIMAQTWRGSRPRIASVESGGIRLDKGKIHQFEKYSIELSSEFEIRLSPYRKPRSDAVSAPDFGEMGSGLAQPRSGGSVDAKPARARRIA